MNKVKRLINKNNILWISVYAGLFLLCSLFPMTSDDIYWHYGVDANSFDDMLKVALHVGNGRFLGNLGVLILVRYPILKIFWKSLIMISVPYFIVKILSLEEWYLKCLCIIVVLLPCSSLIGQVYIWTSGFNNYVPPIAIALFLIYQIKKNLKINNLFLQLLWYIFFFITTISETLFLESCTIFYLFLSGILLYVKNRKKKDNNYVYLFVTGNLVGALIMYFLPIITYSRDNMAGYQTIAESINELILLFLGNASYFLQELAGNFIVFILLSGGTIFLFWKRKKEIVLIKDKIAIGALISFPLLGLFKVLYTGNWISKSAVGNIIMILYTVLYLISLIYLLHNSYSNYQTRFVFTLILLAGISMLPLLILKIARARLIYLPYIIICMAGIYLINIITKEIVWGGAKPHLIRLLQNL